VRLPEVPLIVTGSIPISAELKAVSVMTCVFPEPGAKVAVTPIGRPEAARVTLPENPPAGVTVMVSVTVPPCAIVRLGVWAESVKLGGAFTVTAIVVDAVRLPEVPVMVAVTGPPIVAALAAVRVSTCVPAVPAAKDAVTPVGRPVAAKVTAPANPPVPAMVMVLVAVPPCSTVTLAGEGESVNPGATLTVSAMVAVSVRLPEVPVMVTVTGPPVAAVPVAVSVSTLVPVVVGLGLKLALTPLGSPVAVSVTPPLKPFAGVTVIVSVAVLPCATVTLPD